MNVGSPSGEVRGILGYAYIPNSNEPGKLKVHFDQAYTNLFGDANYWVVALGPVVNG